MAEVVLRGVTWDHPRGIDPMIATSVAFRQLHPDVSLLWETRSLQAFADQPLSALAQDFDLLVIDHPHVGEAARTGSLVALDGLREVELAEIARGSVGRSFESYRFGNRQWALPIDAATPVACRRPDKLERPPQLWRDVLMLARDGQVALALKPINALMVFFGMARNLGYPVAEDEQALLDNEGARHVLELMREIVELIDPRCLELDPIGVLEWMSGDANAPSFSPFGYGYTNYARAGFRPFRLSFSDAPGLTSADPAGTVLGGTGIAVSATSPNRDRAIDFAYFVAGSRCQRAYYTPNGGQPAHADAWEDPACNAATGDFFTRTRRTHELAWLRPRYDGYLSFQDQGGRLVHNCLAGSADIASTIDALANAYRASRTPGQVAAVGPSSAFMGRHTMSALAGRTPGIPDAGSGDRVPQPITAG